MTVDELKGFIRSLAFGASGEAQLKINEGLALIDSLAAKAKTRDQLIGPDSWNWLPTQKR
jgi:hypothetical protein